MGLSFPFLAPGCLEHPGFQRNLRNNLFGLRLPPDADLDSDDWRFDTHPDEPRYAVPLAQQPPRRAWDGYGLHEPCYVKGLVPAPSGGMAGGTVECERIYYTGRGSPRPAGPTSSYAIGFVQWTSRGWVRHPEPVITGSADRPTVVGPQVQYLDGKWRIWYCATAGIPGKGELPHDRIEYAESDDGVRWSEPRVLFTEEDAFHHTTLAPVEAGYEMVASRGHNLFETAGYPAQGLWLLSSASPSGRRQDWSARPQPILPPEPGSWYANGAFGPSLAYGVRDRKPVRHVFFSGVHPRPSWPSLAVRSLAAGRRPPVPAPFYFAVGRLTIPVRWRAS